MFVQSPSSTWISHLSDEKTRHNLSASKTLACLAMKSWFQWDLRSEAFGKLEIPNQLSESSAKSCSCCTCTATVETRKRCTNSNEKKKKNAAQRLWYSSRPWPQHRPSTSAMPSLRCNASHNEKLPETRGEHFAAVRHLFVHLSSLLKLGLPQCGLLVDGKVPWRCRVSRLETQISSPYQRVVPSFELNG